MASKVDRLAVEQRLQRRPPPVNVPVTVSLPPPPGQAFVWQFQDEVVVGSHAVEEKHFSAHRKSSLDSWKPVVTAADIRLRKDLVRKWMRDAHDSVCQCGCAGAHQEQAQAQAEQPVVERRTISLLPKLAPRRSLFTRSYALSLDEFPADDPEDLPATGSQERIVRSLKRLVRRESDRLRSHSLTDLLATAIGAKQHWYRRKGLSGSLASLSGSMPQLHVMEWGDQSEPAPSSALPPEFKVSRVRLDPKEYTPPPPRKTQPLVKFNMNANKVSETYPKAEYDRNGAISKVTPAEMCEIRKEMAKFKLVEMEVSAYSRHNTHIFNDFQCGLTRKKMTSNRRLPPVA